MIYGWVSVLAFLLSSCGGDNGRDLPNNKSSAVPIAGIVADIQAGGSLYDEKSIVISGKYLINISSIVCDGFCEIPGHIPEDAFTFVNTYASYSYNLCGGINNEI